MKKVQDAQDGMHSQMAGKSASKSRNSGGVQLKSSLVDEEEVEDGGVEDRPSIPSIVIQKLSNEPQPEPQNPLDNADFTLIDSFCSFLDQDSFEYPILCGYFKKIFN